MSKWQIITGSWMPDGMLFLLVGNKLSILFRDASEMKEFIDKHEALPGKEKA